MPAIVALILMIQNLEPATKDMTPVMRSYAWTALNPNSIGTIYTHYNTSAKIASVRYLK